MTSERKSGQAIEENAPLTYQITKWYNFIFASIFMIYGGVKIVLSILDRNYEEMLTPIFFLLVGVILISICFAYKELKPWGWYGLLGVNALVVIFALFDLGHFENIIIMILSGAVVYLMMMPTTKSFVLHQH